MQACAGRTRASFYPAFIPEAYRTRLLLFHLRTPATRNNKTLMYVTAVITFDTVSIYITRSNYQHPHPLKTILRLTVGNLFLTEPLILDMADASAGLRPGHLNGSTGIQNFTL